MSDAPVCRLCGKAHWSHESHAWGVSAEKSNGKSQKDNCKTAESNGSCHGCTERDATIADLRAQIAKQPKFDKRAYQRDYMRNRRAKSGVPN